MCMYYKKKNQQSKRGMLARISSSKYQCINLQRKGSLPHHSRTLTNLPYHHLNIYNSFSCDSVHFSQLLQDSPDLEKVHRSNISSTYKQGKIIKILLALIHFINMYHPSLPPHYPSFSIHNNSTSSFFPQEITFQRPPQASL